MADDIDTLIRKMHDKKYKTFIIRDDLGDIFYPNEDLRIEEQRIGNSTQYCIIKVTLDSLGVIPSDTDCILPLVLRGRMGSTSDNNRFGIIADNEIYLPSTSYNNIIQSLESISPELQITINPKAEKREYDARFTYQRLFDEGYSLAAVS